MKIHITGAGDKPQDSNISTRAQVAAPVYGMRGYGTP